MFEQLKAQPADKILALMQAFREDPRVDKIDLGVGVYKNAEGVTPIMRAVKAAEKKWWEEEGTKAYTGLAGDPAYSDAMIALVLGSAVDRDKVADLGLDLRQVGSDIGAMVGGNFVNRFSIAGRSYKVVPQISRTDRLNPDQLKNIYVTGPDNQLVPLSTIATMRNLTVPRSLTV